MSGLAADTSIAPVLDVKGLRVEYGTPRGILTAVRDVDLRVGRGEVLGLIGESGSGKTTAAMACLRLVSPPGRIVAGQVVLNGELDLLDLGEKQLRSVRWRDVALIPQGALNSLNPVLRVRDQIADVIRTHEHTRIRERALRGRIDELFALVGLPSRCYRMYPHELSGGMKQRVCIAMAISLSPPLIIADEPTSALDVIVQRVVGQTLLDIKERLGVSMLLIGHDIGLMAQLADRVAVMYAGTIVETGAVEQVLGNPKHPYTQLLIESVPSIGRRGSSRTGEALTPDPLDRPTGCVFAPRCPSVMPRCVEAEPQADAVEPGHEAACFLHSKLAIPA